MATIEYTDLEDAFDFVSGGEMVSAQACVSRETGRIYWFADNLQDDELQELPEDIEDDSRYAMVPSRLELDLGRSVALRFASDALPDRYDPVRDIFGRRGAYRRFKDLLEREGRLDDWYDYERAAIRKALCEWAAEEGFEVRLP